jgi:hypothetical protein
MVGKCGRAIASYTKTNSFELGREEIATKGKIFAY